MLGAFVARKLSVSFCSIPLQTSARPRDLDADAHTAAADLQQWLDHPDCALAAFFLRGIEIIVQKLQGNGERLCAFAAYLIFSSLHGVSSEPEDYWGDNFYCDCPDCEDESFSCEAIIQVCAAFILVTFITILILIWNLAAEGIHIQCFLLP